MGDLDPGTARMRHPDPTLDDQIVRASQVPHLELSDWEFVEGDRETWPAELQRFEGQPKVRLYHPALQRYETVAESQVGPLRSSGWHLAEEWDAAQAAQGLDDRTLDELKELARERGVKVSGTKDELLARLQSEEQPQDAQDDAGEPADQGDEE